MVKNNRISFAFAILFPLIIAGLVAGVSAFRGEDIRASIGDFLGIIVASAFLARKILYWIFRV